LFHKLKAQYKSTRPDQKTKVIMKMVAFLLKCVFDTGAIPAPDETSPSLHFLLASKENEAKENL